MLMTSTSKTGRDFIQTCRTYAEVPDCGCSVIDGCDIVNVNAHLYCSQFMFFGEFVAC